MNMQQAMVDLITQVQGQLCRALAEVDGAASFGRDSWQRPDGGGGTSCVLEGGAVFAKAGVNVSRVFGTLSEAAAAEVGGGHQLSGPDARQFFACGLSLVLHPRHPMVPTVHANYRYFERGRRGPVPGAWWFGGGSDLTPAYVFEADAVHFHQTLKAACDAHDAGFYPRFKAWCDRYFYLPHRQEARGIGGIFFDDLRDRPPAALLAFVRDGLGAFLPSYLPIVQRRRQLPCTAAQRRWQQLRRGRYAEFNLVVDRGTLFGLRTGGRIESILMSLPPVARWNYNVQPAPGSPEAQLLEVLQAPRDWLGSAAARSPALLTPSTSPADE